MASNYDDSVPIDVDSNGKKWQNTVVSEAYPESEFNPSRVVLSGNGEISIEDLLDPLRGTSNYSKLRKRIQHVEKKEAPVQAPLPKPEPSEFKPRTDFQKTIASLVHDNNVVEAYKSDGGELLELNKLSVEAVKDRQNRLAKMRSLLFRHEMKAKHIKNMKSKTYRCLKKKERMKAASLELQTDPKAAKELAEKQERERAEARMALTHKNQGKWAKRILERGLDKQDEGTRAAISEQLHMHNLLTRKMNSMKDSSSSDDSSYEEDDDFDSQDEDGASKLLEKAKEKTIKLMDQEDEVPDSGVLSLPFMVRGLEKRKEAANEEAKHALCIFFLKLDTYIHVLQSIEDVVDNPGPRTTYEVSVSASGSWKKMKSKGKADPMLDGSAKNKPGAAEPEVDNHIGEVEVEFEKDKEGVLNEENPEPEKAPVLPGWGQWTDVQKKRGTPSWMLEGCANAKRKREEAIKKRKDAGLKHVIISEKVDKKAEKLHVKTLPYPFTSKEVYEQSIRMPIGPESNPAITARALTRPEVVKKAGVIIDPIKFEEVDPHERGEEQKQGGRRRRGKNKASANKSRDTLSLRATAHQKYVYPDPIPEFAQSETRKFKIELKKTLEKDIDAFGDELDKVVGVCAKVNVFKL
ncbi:hypothetical protein Cgig2_007019 [Carnegiea gigantea]|uniref:U3 small nucleolar RNA-associated protein 14 n=1 Tax=Carnegiea gigantea TaxID=171969 RepID=A0A9Q1KAW4_9CARY|nr:hypothetical protein Cgig2_007019 [Carnegiea gigantea]